MTQSSFWSNFHASFKTAIRGRFVLGTSTFLIGVAIPTILFQRPDLLRSDHSADWASAFGSIFAAVIALGLGLYAARQDGRRQRERTHGAALVFLNPISETLVLLNVIAENANAIKVSQAGAEHIRKELGKLPSPLPIEVLEYLTYLPEHAAKLVVLSAQRLRMVKQNVASASTHADMVTEILKGETFLSECFLPLGDQIFAQVVSTTAKPPWKK